MILPNIKAVTERDIASAVKINDTDLSFRLITTLAGATAREIEKHFDEDSIYFLNEWMIRNWLAAQWNANEPSHA